MRHHVETDGEKYLRKLQVRNLSTLFSVVHKKVSIQDATSCFGPEQINELLYPPCFSRTSALSLEAQTHSLSQRLGNLEELSPVGEISSI